MTAMTVMCAVVVDEDGGDGHVAEHTAAESVCIVSGVK